MTVTPEQLAAYADGELAAEAAAEIEAALAQDEELRAALARHRALRSRLAMHFDPIAREPVPDRLGALLRPSGPNGPAGAEVIDLAAARERRRPVPPGGRWIWLAGPALAASLVLVFVGISLRKPSDYAGPELSGALDRQLVAEQTDQTAVRVLLSFRDRNGQYCRGFTAPGQSGVACRDERGWKLREVLAPVDAQQGEYRQAESAASRIMARAQDMAAGAALDSEEEAAARARGWAPR